MGRSSNSRRVTHVPLTAVGSGARLMDLFPLPIWLYVPIRFVAWVLKHWYIFLSLFALFYMPWWVAALVVASLPLTIFIYIYAHNQTRSPQAVARAGLRFIRVRLVWRRACEAAELNDGPRRPRLVGYKRPLKIANDTGTSLEFTLNLARIGLTVKNLEDNKDYLAATLDARRTRVTRLTPGTAKLAIEWEKRLERSAVANPIHQINATQLPRVELDQDVQLELDTSLLVVGESGSGKSNLTWYILSSLNQYGIPHRDYVIDPKKVELADLVEGPYTVAYADNPRDADKVIDRFYTDMMETFEKMKKAGIRKVELGEEYPLCILIVDEALLTRAFKSGIDGPLGEILSAGRAAGFIVLANSQLGQVDALSRLRDLFPQRVCMAVKSSDLTSAVLGPNAEARGARCTEITEKGVGYVYTDHHGSFQRFRPPLIADIHEIAMGGFYIPAVKQTLFSKFDRAFTKT